MHPVAKKCVWWAVGIAGTGSLFTAYGSQILYEFAEFVGANAEPALYVFGFITSLIRGFALPLAAALTGAAVVIQTLAPKPAPASDVSTTRADGPGDASLQRH